MKVSAVSALFQDALYQVLDNWVFRILAVLTGCLVLVTFLIGFREDEVVLLFGLKTWSYADLTHNFGQAWVQPGLVAVYLA